MSIQIIPAEQPTVWKTPTLIPKPLTCRQVKHPVIRLNTADGVQWHFCMNPVSEEEILAPGMPSSGLSPVEVPGNVLMQGFDIKNDTPYYYKAPLSIPQDFAGNCIFLRFHGVYSTATVWVNGSPAGEHIGGFTTWDCDITGLVSPGETAELVVRFVDVLNDVSIASRYAHFNIGGINRPVELLCVPQEHLTRFHYETVFDADYRNAELRLFFGTALADAAGAGLQFALTAPDGTAVPLAEQVLALSGLPSAFGAVLPIQAPLKWDSEHPNLYMLTVTLVKDGIDLETVSRRVGFREITYGGARGTDLNKLYVNGQPVKLRGTCHHDVHPQLGRAITPELAEEDVRMIKASNMNYIRTSHYPPTEELLDACDRYGIYVEEENAACFQFTHAAEENFQRGDSRWYVAPFAEMVERDRSHPCVAIWSLGNESLWHAQYQEEYDYLKQTDCSRPAKFSYPDKEALDGVTPCYDIFSMHYIPYNGAMSLSPKPTLHDEYVHVPCYDLSELTADPNVRNFWGESIHKAWECIVETDGALGGAVWAGIDDVFPIPEGTHESHQQHSTGSAAGYGEWGNYADIWRREKPEFWLTKKAYSPVRIAEHCLPKQTPGQPLCIPVTNWFNHTNLNEMRFHWEVDGVQGVTAGPDVSPYQKGTLTIPCTSWTQSSVLKLCCDSAAMSGEWIDCWELAIQESPVQAPPLDGSAVPQITETPQTLDVTAGTVHAVFSKESGLLCEVTAAGETLLTGGPHLLADGVVLDSWTLASLAAETAGNTVRVTVTGHAGTVPIRLLISLTESGMQVDYCHTGELELAGIETLGLTFDVPAQANQIQWSRKGFYSSYPEDHIGRNAGTAARFRVGWQETPDTYGKQPAWSWKDDMRNFFLYQKDSDADGLATHDFLALREQIANFTVYFEGQDSAVRVLSDETDSAKMQVYCTLTDKIDDCSPAIHYSAEKDGVSHWQQLDDIVSFRATLHRTNTPNAFASYTFSGCGIQLIGPMNEEQGDFEVVLDGVSRGIFSARSSIGSTLVQQVLFSDTALADSTHTIQIINRGSTLILDALERFDSTRSAEETTRLAVLCHWNYPDLSWGNYMRPSITWKPQESHRVRLDFVKK